MWRVDLTWAHVPILDSNQINHLVSLCDSAEHVRSSSVQLAVESNVPFGVFPSYPVPHSLNYGAPLKDEEAFLFKHYVDHVALIMMPYDDQRNPWKSSYPAEALHSKSQEQRALLHAMIAQNLLMQAAKYYTLAIEELRSCMEGSPAEYASFIAAISTLMFVEIYSGHSATWRTHFNGAWAILKSREADEPWNLSEFAWASTQSLCLINILNESSIKYHEKAPLGQDQDQNLRLIHKTPSAFISSASSFGFTIGDTQLLMSCIIDINKLALDIQKEGDVDIIDKAVNDLYSRLEACRESQVKGMPNDENDSSTTSKEYRISWHHLNAFIAATHIYLHRTIFDLPPSNEIIKNYVGEVFENVEKFLDAGGGNLSLWPAFIAAVEANEAQHVDAARKWLDFAVSVGMGNRFKAKIIVEKAWSLREKLAKEAGTSCGDISVDWRDVMVNLDLDILLV
ncbi:hypothetical protein BP5796_12480 [Coleophoma crateriformis]|uniref:Uncharacterized protein n=1 Tax=Coleophoma crateriformis TaxID=565419 RepID=A0A3D8Q796_9HELO|nr:hypothetical protein BP5796_12480 [Coleophoma crateriformis]